MQFGLNNFTGRSWNQCRMSCDTVDTSLGEYVSNTLFVLYTHCIRIRIHIRIRIRIRIRTRICIRIRIRTRIRIRILMQHCTFQVSVGMADARHPPAPKGERPLCDQL